MSPPTFETDATFDKQWRNLTAAQKQRFMAKVMDSLVPTLANHQTPPPGLRIKRVQGTVGIFEMTQAPNGRATFEYGTEVKDGETHIIWRRIGTHAIFDNP